MPKLVKKRTKRIGLPPGSLVHIGEKRTEEIKITIIDYDDMHIQEKEIKTIDECFPFKNKPTVTWINIDGIHQVEIIEKIGKHFKLHPLALEDIMHTKQRPKMEDFGDYIFIVLKIPYCDEKDNKIKVEQISLILGPNFVISFQEIEKALFNPIRERLRNVKSRIRKFGADYLTYTLIDVIVDNYFMIMENLEKRIEDIEEELITDPTSETLHAIHKLKREMIFLGKSVWPLREVINSLERGESSLIKETTEIYFRDVYDHSIRVINTIETLKEMITGMLDIYLSSVSKKLNEIMKVLTIIGTIFIPLTFITGIYGMNFRYMPELNWFWGYPIALFIMVGVGISMMIYIRRKKWL